MYCSRTCVAINVRRAWRTSACGAAKPWKSSGMENFCRVRAETIEPLAIFRPATLKFCRQNGPRFGVQKRTPKWRPLIQSQFDLLVSGRLGPRFGVQKTDPKTGAVCRQNFCRRAKIVQVSIVSAGMRQKFCIPLGHLVLQRREQLFSTPCERLCPHLFLNCTQFGHHAKELQGPRHPLHVQRTDQNGEVGGSPVCHICLCKALLVIIQVVPF